MRLCRDCYYQLCQLHVISRSLTSTATATLVHAFVTSWLDYCFSLYVGLPAGMGFLCRKDCSPGFFLAHSTLASKLFSLVVQGVGALLSSNLEGAQYKSP